MLRSFPLYFLLYFWVLPQIYRNPMMRIRLPQRKDFHIRDWAFLRMFPTPLCLPFHLPLQIQNRHHRQTLLFFQMYFHLLRSKKMQTCRHHKSDNCINCQMSLPPVVRRIHIRKFYIRILPLKLPSQKIKPNLLYHIFISVLCQEKPLCLGNFCPSFRSVFSFSQKSL